MGTEIERKFLVIGDGWRAAIESATPIRQGYLAVGPPTAVRVRIRGDQANLNVKKSTLDITRAEFEYPIPLEDACQLLDLCEGFIVEKTRHHVTYGGLLWEIDVFEGENQGLIVAEVELESADQPFQKPPWAGKEVSGDPRYLNSHLSRNPYSQWRVAGD